MHLLVREVALVAVGAACATGIQRFLPLTDDIKRPFLAVVVAATAIVMAKTAGIL